MTWSCFLCILTYSGFLNRSMNWWILYPLFECFACECFPFGCMILFMSIPLWYSVLICNCTYCFIHFWMLRLLVKINFWVNGFTFYTSTIFALFFIPWEVANFLAYHFPTLSNELLSLSVCPDLFWKPLLSRISSANSINLVPYVNTVFINLL